MRADQTACSARRSSSPRPPHTPTVSSPAVRNSNSTHSARTEQPAHSRAASSRSGGPCPDQPGVNPSGGCPPELRSTPKLTAAPTGGGIVVKKLSVSAPKGAKVEVRCRRGCSGHQARTAGVVSFPLLRGRSLPAGAVIEVFVTKAKAIGAYTRYDIVRGNFKRVDRCLRPGSHKPRKKCK